ncbi:uncharacterized protein PHALS_14611 [Plasmopara halstedii]|uniref:Uncharacterized protein n=1 Tax=Plasmopara halstedii TaxID=4781 RepID=A0A0N7L5S8_PLAHL|nr:uncharacterized protein PHALS_14611 [Plasmopara halstedii]CEG42315.1 hypothetical protein PHALS_14611 [Plasmopara halstedii]|eukprot:XP_024578684.1 hypothetical protein PHALS_14611 [Plasmopara halstedii]
MEAGHENSSKRRDRLMHVFMKKSLYHLSSLTTPLEIHTELSHLPETSGQQHIITPAQTLHSSDIVHQSYFMTRLKAYFDAADSKTKSDLQSIYFAKMQSMTQSEKSNSPPSTRKSSTYIEIATYMALWVKDKKLP